MTPKSWIKSRPSSSILSSILAVSFVLEVLSTEHPVRKNNAKTVQEQYNTLILKSDPFRNIVRSMQTEITCNLSDSVPAKKNCQASEEKSTFRFLYPGEMPLLEKVETIAKKIYGADRITVDKKTSEKFGHLEKLGFGKFPICVAKTQYSLSADPTLRCRPSGFDVPIRDVKVSAGAGFVVVLTGEIMTMPGLSKSPAAERIDIDATGQITGLF